MKPPNRKNESCAIPLRCENGANAAAAATEVGVGNPLTPKLPKQLWRLEKPEASGILWGIWIVHS